MNLRASDVNETVFLVDDDAAVVKAISRLLRAKGYTVAAFGSAQEFMERYEASASGCLVLDLSMPGITGLELQRWLSARNSSLPIIFLTGSDELIHRKDFFGPTIEVLLKPITGSSFIKVIEKALARNRGLQDNAP